MSKTAKCCAIFFITTLWLVIWRMVFSVVNLSDNVSDWLFSIIIQIFGLGIIPLLLFKFWVKEDILTGFSIKVKIPKIIWVLAVVLGFLLSYLTRGVSLVWQNMLILLGYTHVKSVGTIYSDAGVLVMDLFTTAMLPAIFEEVTDRGLVIRMFRDVKDDKVTMVLVATMFGLVHQNIVQTGYTFVGGLIFAFLAIKTRSILPGMIIHCINNGLSVLSSYSDQHNGFIATIGDWINDFISKHMILAIISWIAVAVAIVAILKYVSKLTEKEETEKKENEEVFFYTDRMNYVDDLFGIPKNNAEIKPTNTGVAWYEYAFLYGAVVMTALTTIFTFMWGVWR